MESSISYFGLIVLRSLQSKDNVTSNNVANCDEQKDERFKALLAYYQNRDKKY
ncbi:hypothetical protein HPY18_18300 [Vibrio parahaemolyticus]|uniref:hypothetical protein n=1 Tax=Vibrio parahaemolyticus TaxID=670 RepID=UPI00168A27B1|nr:hypothetical protein [Vibrio parahaemolyticus]MBD2856324.1 hypothetical protein [Vibrio parahaemolyticus]